MTFAVLFVSEKRDKGKVSLSLYGGSKPPPYAQSPSIANRKSKKYTLYPVSAHIRFTPAAHYPAGVQTMRARIC